MSTQQLRGANGKRFRVLIGLSSRCRILSPSLRQIQRLSQALLYAIGDYKGCLEKKPNTVTIEATQRKSSG